MGGISNPKSPAGLQRHYPLRATPFDVLRQTDTDRVGFLWDESVLRRSPLVALVSLFYLQAAILNGSFVEVDQAESGPVGLVKALPSAGDWMKHIQFVARHA